VRHRQLRQWYAEALHAYNAGYQHVAYKEAPTGMANTRTAAACYERGREDGARETRPAWDEIPLDLWAAVIARKTAPAEGPRRQ